MAKKAKKKVVKTKPLKKNKAVVKKKTTANKVLEGRVYINATFNNTLVTITDLKGKTLAWVSSGSAGFSGTKKSTPYAAITTVNQGMEKVSQLGMRRIQVMIKGPGPGREAALKVLRSRRDLDIISISDVTPIPHNGPRPPKMKKG